MMIHHLSFGQKLKEGAEGEGGCGLVCKEVSEMENCIVAPRPGLTPPQQDKNRAKATKGREGRSSVSGSDFEHNF